MKLRLSLFAFVLLASAKIAHAQIGGCDDSPECPTLVLATLAISGMAVNRFRKR